MRLATLESRLSQANTRANNANAKKYIDKVVDKFNKSAMRERDNLNCESTGDVFNFASVNIVLHNKKEGRIVKTISVSLP